MEIKDKICLVTGSAIRVGKAIALTLAGKGAKLAIHYNSQENKAQETAEEIRKMKVDSILLKADISRKEDWLRMREDILNKWGKIDILVNNAAVFFRTPFLNIEENQWSQFIDINLRGTLYGCQVMGEVMLQNQSGKIINIADVSAESPWPNYIPYCISKAGVIALTKGLAQAFAPHITVNAVSPGTVMLAEEYDEEEENNLINRTPLKRVGNPQDIANSVVFLIEGSDFITGSVIKVDGGRSLT
jgi:NAD(P)-dependent dehydrogenase (short-subunit alcohol dehydrogenase family)